MWTEIGLTHYLVVAAALFAIGLYTVATRRNLVAVLMGVELIFNAAALNFVAFSHWVEGAVGGQVFALFVIVIAPTEAAVALAIVLAIWRNFRSIDADETTELRQ
jgi:NADH-quinone oxidoreductase subunit K